jgi:diadenosine tetraphosphatase ApaH/serine/threonine PP2A family protein phosphatase
MDTDLIGRLPAGPLDLVGDVHGEFDALMELLKVLGYDERGRHPRDRTLVFVGDLCDRGPDSPSVVEWVRQRHEEGRAQVVLGNHELNLLRGLRKDGNDWFYGDVSNEGRRFEPFRMLAGAAQNAVLDFFDQLPLALERADLRVVHAAWHAPSIEKLRQVRARVSVEYRRQDAAFRANLEHQQLALQASEERVPWTAVLRDAEQSPPALPLLARWDSVRQMGNPIRVLSSGVELPIGEPFFAGGAWRFVQRASWWDDYADPVPVIIGHYWRRFAAPGARAAGAAGPDLFAELPALCWHGACRQVFCIDFSVGGRFHERRHGRAARFEGRLAALRWPERSVFFDDGERCATEGYGGLRP